MISSIGMRQVTFSSGLNVVPPSGMASACQVNFRSSTKAITSDFSTSSFFNLMNPKY